MFRKLTSEEKNIRFLDKLKAGEQVGIDQDGRLYKVKTGEASEVDTATRKAFDGIALQYVVHSLQKKEFLDVTKGPQAFQAMIGKLVSTHLLEGKALQTSLTIWYNQRYRTLEEGGFHPDFAEAFTTIEMSQDPYLSAETKELIRPQPTSAGMSGSYFIKNRNGEKVGVFKPMDEEPYMPNNPNEAFQRDYNPKTPQRVQALRYGATQGGSWQREIVAWEIDKGEFAGVPPTGKLRIPFPVVQGSNELTSKVGSFQKFVRGEQLSELTAEQIDEIPVSELHKIAAFDLAMGNADRNSENMLYDAENQTLHPIDQGLILLDSVDWKKPEDDRWVSESSFHWQTYPQMAEPIHEGAQHWIGAYDIEYEVAKMRQLGISEGAIREHKIRMIFLKEGVKQGISFARLAQLVSQPDPNSPVRGGTWLDTQIHTTIRALKQQDVDPNNEELFFEAFAQVLPQVAW